MSKVAVVYWSGTGNTEAMANAVVEGVTAAGGEAQTFPDAAFTADDIAGFDTFAFGCPAMGAEVLEEDSFQPMWDSVKESLSGKKVGLFGSWGWGGGEWMEDWKADAEGAGVQLVGAVTAENEPDDAALDECRNLGRQLAE